MIITDSKKRTVEIADRDWPLAEGLFLKWGHTISLNTNILVPDVHEITPELSMWGIPWRRVLWD